MKRLVVERQVIIKELWEVPDDWDPSSSMAMQGQRRNYGWLNVAPVTVRDYIEGESLEPCLERSRERAERGYWSRMMNYIRSH